MKKLFLSLLLALALVSQAQAAQTSGVLTASASACTATAGVAMPLGPADASATIQLAGTFTGTVSFTVSSNGGGTYTAANGTPSTLGASTSTATAVGSWVFDVAGKTNICAYISSYTSGTVNVAINSSSAYSNSGGVGSTPQSLTTTSTPTFTAVYLEGTTADAYETLLTPTDPTAARTVTFPDSTFTAGRFEVACHVGAAALMVDQSCFQASRAYQVVAIYFIHAVAETTAANLRVQVTKDVSTNAPGAGTDLLTNNTNAGFDGKATANTTQAGTLTATGASLIMAAGDRLSLDFEAGATELAGVTITIGIQPIN